MQSKYQYMFTVFTPTYNRAHVLPEVYASLEAQNCNDFEWLIVDDGSTDDTESIVRELQAKATFPITYHWQTNQGKHVAHNTALQLARGFLFITLDAGDILLPQALTRLKHYWNSIPDEKKTQFAGVAGRCLNEDGTLSGEPYHQNVIDSDYLEIFRFNKMNGERREAIRVDVLRQFPYPILEGEYHIRPTLILRRMAHHYKLRFTNEPLEINRHENDGITANRFRYRMNNPKGLRLYFQEEINLHNCYTRPKKLFRQYVQYVRYSLHSKVGLIQQKNHIQGKWIWLLALIPGAIEWLNDNRKKLFMSNNK